MREVVGQRGARCMVDDSQRTALTVDGASRGINFSLLFTRVCGGRRSQHSLR